MNLQERKIGNWQLKKKTTKGGTRQLMFKEGIGLYKGSVKNDYTTTALLQN